MLLLLLRHCFVIELGENWLHETDTAGIPRTRLTEKWRELELDMVSGHQNKSSGEISDLCVHGLFPPLLSVTGIQRVRKFKTVNAIVALTFENENNGRTCLMLSTRFEHYWTRDKSNY